MEGYDDIIEGETGGKIEKYRCERDAKYTDKKDLKSGTRYESN